MENFDGKFKPMLLQDVLKTMSLEIVNCFPYSHLTKGHESVSNFDLSPDQKILQKKSRDVTLRAFLKLANRLIKLVKDGFIVLENLSSD